jgi:hypothetical protein
MAYDIVYPPTWTDVVAAADEDDDDDGAMFVEGL